MGKYLLACVSTHVPRIQTSQVIKNILDLNVLAGEGKASIKIDSHGARRLMRMVANLDNILGIELLCAAQGIHFRSPLKTSPALQAVIARLRKDVPVLGSDRYIAPELETAARLVRSGEIQKAAGIALPELGA